MQKPISDVPVERGAKRDERSKLVVCPEKLTEDISPVFLGRIPAVAKSDERLNPETGNRHDRKSVAMSASSWLDVSLGESAVEKAC